MTEQTVSLSDRIDSAREQLQDAAEKLQKAVLGFTGRVEQSSSEFFQSLISAGEQVEKEREKARKSAARKKPEPTLVEGYANRLVANLGLPTADELQALNKKIDSLTRKVRKLEKASA